MDDGAIKTFTDVPVGTYTVTLDVDATEPAALVRAGQRAVEAGEWQRASQLVQLALLRAVSGAGSLFDVLIRIDALQEGGEVEAVRVLRDADRGEVPTGAGRV